MNRWHKQRLVHQLRALRHLPPNTALNQPVHSTLRELLEQLLHLSEETDPIEWISLHAQDTASQILLWHILDRLKAELHGVQHIRTPGSRDLVRQRLGYLAEISPDAAPFHALAQTEPVVSSPDLLRHIVAGLRAVLAEMPNTPPSAGLGDYLFGNYFPILHEILRRDLDPLDHIRSHHLTFASAHMLHHLLNQLIPPRSTAVDRLHASLPPLDEAVAETPVTFSDLQLEENGFNFTLHLNMIAPERPVTETPIGFSLRWEGIEVVQDDLGYHYLVCQRRYQISGSGLSRFTGVIEMLCSPSVMPDAGFLHVSGSDQALVVLGMLPGEPETQRRALDEVPIGNWSLTFPLGSRPA